MLENILAPLLLSLELIFLRTRRGPWSAMLQHFGSHFVVPTFFFFRIFWKLQRRRFIFDHNRWLHRFVFLDEIRTFVLTELFRHLIFKGQKQVSQRLFFFSLRFIKKFCSVLIPKYLAVLVHASAFVPYRVSSIRSSNRTYHFPVPVATKKQLAFVHKQFRLFFGGPKWNAGDHRLTRIVSEFLSFISYSEQNLLLTFLRDNLVLGYNNRMFLHYRWRFRKKR